MEFLDRRTFEDCMRQVLSRLDRQEEMLSAMRGDVNEKPQGTALLEEDTMDNQDVCMLGHRLVGRGHDGQPRRVHAAPREQTYPATLPQRRIAALPDAPPQDLLPQGGRGTVHQHPHAGNAP